MQNDVPEQKNVTFAMEYQMKWKSIRWNRKKCIKFFCLDGRISESVVFPECGIEACNVSGHNYDGGCRSKEK